ncbi:MAG: hypothetical protein ACKO85_05820 [Isosphaeraceae bacterium]
MKRELPEAREVVLVRGLFAPDAAERAGELVQKAIPGSLWLVKIRTAEVTGEVIFRSSLGGFPLEECMCIDLKLDRAVPVEPALRFHIQLAHDETLQATGVVRPWD